MSKATERIAAIRDVLRHLDHPERLQLNPLVSWQFLGVSEQASGAARVKQAIDLAIEGLSPRQREIVRRCDLRGHPHRSVINDLGITERHFYRERRSALDSIGAKLAAPKQTTVTVLASRVPSEPPELQMAFVEAARQVGDTSRAISLLTDALAETGVHRRVQIECRLAELYCELSEIEKASSHLKAARELTYQASDATENLRLQSDSVEAAVAWRTGRADAATTFANRAIRGLRAAVSKQGTPGDTRALALSLLVLSEIDVAKGRWQSGRWYALEARDAITITGFGFAALKSRAALAATFAYMFEPAHLNDAAIELEGQYRSAVAAGLTLEAILVRLHLCLTYRFANSPHESAAVLEEILVIAKHVLPAEQYAIVCLELANSYVLCGKGTQALRAIEEARIRVLPGGNTSAFIDLLSAAAFLSAGDWQRALDLSIVASQSMEKLGVVTSIGESLRIQAEARYGLGDKQVATDLIGSALSRLEVGGHPFTIAQTHQSAGRITGNQKHYRVAHEILGTLRPHR